MSQLKIRNALEKSLATFAASKSIPVVWENISTIPTTSYLKAFIFPAATQDPSMGASHQRYRGMFKVTYYCTDVGKGMKSIEEFVDSLVAYFPRNTQLVKDNVIVHITNTPTVNSPNYEANYLYISCEIYYRADILN